MKKLLYVIPIALLFSCNKEIDQLTTIESKKILNSDELIISLQNEVDNAGLNTEQRSAVWLSPENSNNPYDYVGQWHNEGLDYIKLKYNPNSNYIAFTSETCTGKLCDDRIKKVAGLSLEFVNLELGKKNIFTFEQLIPLLNESTQINPEEFELFINENESVGNITEDERKILNLYTKLVYNLRGNIKPFIAASKAFENQISSSNLSEIEKIRLLTIISIGKWSGFYWDNNIDDDDQQKKAKWWKIALADIGGALIGVATGLGLDLPGATDLESATIGGVSCSAAASYLASEG